MRIPVPVPVRATSRLGTRVAPLTPTTPRARTNRSRVAPRERLGVIARASAATCARGPRLARSRTRSSRRGPRVLRARRTISGAHPRVTRPREGGTMVRASAADAVAAANPNAAVAASAPSPHPRTRRIPRRASLTTYAPRPRNFPNLPPEFLRTGQGCDGGRDVHRRRAPAHGVREDRRWRGRHPSPLHLRRHPLRPRPPLPRPGQTRGPPRRQG